MEITVKINEDNNKESSKELEKSFINLSTIKGGRITKEALNIEINYLIPKFLVEKSLNLIYARGGQGKSWLMLAIALKLLDELQVSECLYLDMDNSRATLKDRKMDELLEEYPNLYYIHRSSIEGSPRDFLYNLADTSKVNSEFFEDKLVIIDSIRDFTEGKDINSDKDIIPLMNKLKDLREAGSTVIFLHHTTKEGEGKTFKGSTSFRDSVDVAYSLSSKRKKNILTYELEVDKDRISVENCLFELDTKEMSLTSENLLLNASKLESEFVTEVRVFLNKEFFFGENMKEGIKQAHIIKKFKGRINEKTVRKYLHKHAGEFWDLEKKTSENNTVYYSPLKLPK